MWVKLLLRRSHNHPTPTIVSWSYRALYWYLAPPNHVQTPPGPRSPGFNSSDRVISPFHDAKDDAQVRARLRKTKPPVLPDIAAGYPVQRLLSNHSSFPPFPFPFPVLV